ncbi:MAG: CbtB domain-containing protein [Azospirillaceae bacterium]
MSRTHQATLDAAAPAAAGPRAGAPERPVAAALLAAGFGLALIFGAGFAGSATIHNAAHDSRHAVSFPCH